MYMALYSYSEIKMYLLRALLQCHVRGVRVYNVMTLYMTVGVGTMSCNRSRRGDSLFRVFTRHGTGTLRTWYRS